MLMDMDVSMAIKNIYGQYDIKSFSLFEIEKINGSFTYFKVKVTNGWIVIRIKCSLCDNYHCYRYSVNEFVRRELIIGGCESLGLPLFYIGNYNKVKEIVDKCNDINKNLRVMM